MSSSKEKLLHWLIRCQLACLRKSSRKFRYQPKAWCDDASVDKNATRDSVDRLKLISGYLDVGGRDQRSTQTVLDIGSNAGYFLTRLAQLGYCVHGIERDPDLVYLTNAIALVSGCERMSCECATLNEEYLARKTPFDIVLNFSVMHHVILHEGIDTATRILTSLAQLTRKEMYFEMGHSGEKSDWASKLPDMGSDPEAWIADWLKSSGFSVVEKIGESPTTVPRPLFRCRHDQT